MSELDGKTESLQAEVARFESKAKEYKLELEKVKQRFESLQLEHGKAIEQLRKVCQSALV